MTDCSLVKQELKALLSENDDEIENYGNLIECAVKWVSSLIENEKNENDALIIHLCAVKLYYQISLLHNDSVSSFSAGEVSFSMENSMESARKLLDDAILSCKKLLTGNCFAFKAV